MESGRAENTREYTHARTTGATFAKCERTCEPKLSDSEFSQLREAFDNELHVRGLQPIIPDVELLQGLELRHGPGEG
jgi:hypothetical protein